MLFRSITDDYSDDVEIRKVVSQNDIGKLPIFKKPEMISDLSRSNALFEFIYNNFLLPSYNLFKDKYPSSAYSNFTKNDTNYYRSVIPILVKFTQKSWINGANLKRFFDNFFNESIEEDDQIINFDDEHDEYKPGLSQELTDYRKMIYQQYQGSIQAYEVFTNHQRSKIVFHKPRNLNALKEDCGLSAYSVKNFGEEILRIVQKYHII